MRFWVPKFGLNTDFSSDSQHVSAVFVDVMIVILGEAIF
jgi:hypothetical protein